MPAIEHDFSTALFHHRTGDLANASRLYRRVLLKRPHHAEALHLLGVIASEEGRHQEAAALIVHAIRASGPTPLYCLNLGLVLTRQGQWEPAGACYRQAIDLKPSESDTRVRLSAALLDLANQLHLARRWDEAAEHYEQALATGVVSARIWYNLGVTRMAQSRVDEALAAYREALRLDPGYAEAHNNLGVLLQATGSIEDAAVSYLQAAAARADFVDPHYNLAMLRQDQDQLSAAEEGYRHVLALQPDHPEAQNNLGNTLLARGSLAAALCSYEAAVARHPEHAQARWNIGLMRLLLGDFAQGWPGYEWRLRQKESTPRVFRRPQWDGAPLASRRILFDSEQGLGDTLQFIRYAALVKERQGIVVVVCPASLARLLETVPGVDEVVTSEAPLPDFDCHTPLLSLPGILGTRLETIPAAVPYLRPAAGLVERWREFIAARRDTTRLAVGLAWAGNPRHKNDRNRSVPGAQLAALAGLADVQFFSLQKDATAAVAGLPITPLAEHAEDLADSAAMIENLDLVISVDSAVAHLAGALGKPVWTLLPYVPDWRWMLEREDSPWYPSMRLFRQPGLRDWPSVLERVRAELRAFTP